MLILQKFKKFTPFLYARKEFAFSGIGGGGAIVHNYN